MGQFKIPIASRFEKAMSYVMPKYALSHYKSRVSLSAASHIGASKSRRQTSDWVYSRGQSADSDTIADLPTLRDRSRDLIRNNPIAAGAIKTKVTNIVGNGFQFHARMQNEILGIEDEPADEWNSRVEQEFNSWANDVNCDYSRTLKFGAIQALYLRSMFENGDSFCVLPFLKRDNDIYGLKLQLIEADRVANGDNTMNSAKLVEGIELEEGTGAPTAYRILNRHPGSIDVVGDTGFNTIKAFGSLSGRRNILHMYMCGRIGQHRGVPDLTPVIELFKQLGNYTDAELMRSVISSMFTVFVKTEMPGITPFAPFEPTDEVGGKASDKDFKMASGAILDLGPGEDVEFANPTSPNVAFDEFVVALLRQIGVGLEIPFEVLVKHFTASYSASRGALIIAWQYFICVRKQLIDDFCKEVYKEWFREAVLLDRIHAPGFLNGDPIIQAAYLNSEWIGPSKPQIDEDKEIKAAIARMGANVTTLADEVASHSGGSWRDKLKQAAKESKLRKTLGISAATPPGETNGQEEQQPKPGQDRPEDESDED